MRYLHDFTGTHKNNLKGVLFTKDKAVATDSFKLIEATHDFNIKEPTLVDLPHKRIIEDVKIDAGMTTHETTEETKEFAKEHDVDVPDMFESKGATITDRKGEDRANTIKGEYPKYEKIKPEGEPVATIKLNAKYLKEVARFIEYNTKDVFKGVTIEIHDKNDPVVFRDGKNDIYGLIMPQSD